MVYFKMPKKYSLFCAKILDIAYKANILSLVKIQEKLKIISTWFGLLKLRLLLASNIWNKVKKGWFIGFIYTSKTRKKHI